MALRAPRRRLSRGQALSRRRQSRLARAPAAAIKKGDRLPDATLSTFSAEGDIKQVSVSELVAGKRVVLFAVPGAYAPTCSLKHLPGFLDRAEELKAKGVDTIACVAVNDTFVMDAWGKSLEVDDRILMLADGSAKFTKALGVELDLTEMGLGVRSRRYAMLVEDGVVQVLNLEEAGGFTVSSAEDILQAL